MSNNIRTLFDGKMQQDSRRKCKSKVKIYTLSNKRISQSNRREIERKPQDRIVTFNDLDRVRYNRQLFEAEGKEKKGDIILNVVREDGSQYFLYPYFNLSGSTVFINPKDPSKGLYEKNGKFYYGKTGGDTGNELKTFTKEKIEELKIKRIMGEKDFYKRINETELDKYFGKLKKPGYIVGSHFPTFEIEGLMYDVIKEPMDNIVKEPMDNVGKKNNHKSTLTHESTGIDSNNTHQTYPHDTNINQNNTNFLDGSYEDYLWLNNCNNINLPNNNDSHEFDGFSIESHEQPGIEYVYDFENNDLDCYYSSKPDYYCNKQTDEWQQINNNVNYNTNLNYPYINDYPYTYHNGFSYL